MFITKKHLKKVKSEIYDAIDLNYIRAIDEAKAEVEIKDITPILKELAKLESRIEKLEKK